MDWEETVMSEKQMEDIIWHTATEGIPTQRGYGGALVKAQAKITGDIAGKIGYDKAMAQLADMTEECKRLGKKEVVEFVEEHIPKTLANYVGFWHKLQDQKKEWGI